MQAKDPPGQPSQCACTRDAFAALPPELRPRSQEKDSLRQVICPGCRQVHRANRPTDICIRCEKMRQNNEQV